MFPIKQNFIIVSIKKSIVISTFSKKFQETHEINSKQKILPKSGIEPPPSDFQSDILPLDYSSFKF